MQRLRQAGTGAAAMRLPRCHQPRARVRAPNVAKMSSLLWARGGGSCPILPAGALTELRTATRTAWRAPAAPRRPRAAPDACPDESWFACAWGWTARAPFKLPLSPSLALRAALGPAAHRDRLPGSLALRVPSLGARALGDGRFHVPASLAWRACAVGGHGGGKVLGWRSGCAASTLATWSFKTLAVLPRAWQMRWPPRGRRETAAQSSAGGMSGSRTAVLPAPRATQVLPVHGRGRTQCKGSHCRPAVSLATRFNNNCPGQGGDEQQQTDGGHVLCRSGKRARAHTRMPRQRRGAAHGTHARPFTAAGKGGY